MEQTKISSSNEGICAWIGCLIFISLKIDLKSKGAFDINVSGGWNKLKYASQIKEFVHEMDVSFLFLKNWYKIFCDSNLFKVWKMSQG